MRLKAIVSYDGSNYLGFQVQGESKTIQHEIQTALAKITKEVTPIYASGRTDAGVHAENQVFHFDSKIEMGTDNWKKALNSLLPSDIYIKSVEKVHADFHARFDVATKEYIYLLNMKAYNPLQAKYVCQYGRNLNVELMHQSAQLFVGEHNFQSFCSNKSEETPNFVRTIVSFSVSSHDGIVEFKVIGHGFLRYMVRMMVGVLVEIGRGNKDSYEISNRLDQKERQVVPYNAPACGLYLNHVTYTSALHNYHTHTSRCKHAVGLDEEYVVTAINQGFQTLGFSDHLMSPTIQEDWKMRGEPSELKDYLESIHKLKDKYHNQIAIHVGMECEYFPVLEQELRHLLITNQCDYLILGLHYLHIDASNRITTYAGNLNTKELIIEYANLACEAMKSGLFSIFAHPDIFMFDYHSWDETAQMVSERICRCALEHDVALEVNLRGIYFFKKEVRGSEERHPYPYRGFFEIAKKIGNKIIIGVDAHDPKELTREKIGFGLDFLKEIDLTYTQKINFKKV